jgi:hypothetical protein
MKNDDFWSVELGVGMGPLVLGTNFESLLAVLKDNRIDVNSLTLNRSNELAVPEIGIHCVFSNTNPRTLIRIDVSDDRLRFGSLPVIGKRAHEIVGLFKLPRKETLWCDIENKELASSTSEIKSDTTAMSRELLARGTIWITGHGLGLKLRDGLVEIVHLCDPSQSPQTGHGPWTKEQQRLSEVRELPAASTAPTARNLQSISIFNVLIHVALVTAIGTLVWWAVQLQQRWDAAIEVPATVVALDPPPPNPLPDKVTVSFKDAGGNEQRHTLGFMQFMTTPKMGDEVNVKFLPESPKQVLGPVAFRDVGFETALPYGIGILAIYSSLQLLLFGRSQFRRRRRRRPS